MTKDNIIELLTTMADVQHIEFFKETNDNTKHLMRVRLCISKCEKTLSISECVRLLEDLTIKNNIDIACILLCMPIKNGCLINVDLMIPK